ncbi:hypothetical protein PENTCL1PPCAC_11398, partial [Pristionchus entomophagus]
VMKSSKPTSFASIGKKVTAKPSQPCQNVQVLKALMENPEMVTFLLDEHPEKYNKIDEILEKTNKK